MNTVALLTPTYGRDLEICTLLCESVDRHVTSFSKHYLLVPDCDLPVFAAAATLIRNFQRGGRTLTAEEHADLAASIAEMRIAADQMFPE